MIPEKRQQYYDRRRTRTMQKVQAGIDQIKAEGREVTKKELMEITGLSTGTFSKDHVKEVLKKNQVCQYAPIKTRYQQSQRVLASRMPSKKPNPQADNELINVMPREDMIKSLREENQKLTQELLELRAKYYELQGKYKFATMLLTKNPGIKLKPFDDKDDD